MLAHVAVNVTDLEAAKGFYSARSNRSDTAWCTRSPAGSRTSRMRTASTSGSASEGLSAEPTWRSTAAIARPSTASTRPRSRPAASTTARPGLRPQYDANYYAAYVLDLDGNNIEAVCHHAPT